MVPKTAIVRRDDDYVAMQHHGRARALRGAPREMEMRPLIC
jgi:hypothetical protein